MSVCASMHCTHSRVFMDVWMCVCTFGFRDVCAHVRVRVRVGGVVNVCV